MALDSMKEIFETMQARDLPFWEVVLRSDMEDRQVSRNQSLAKMLTVWQAMSDAADNYSGRRRSASGLVGGDGMRMRQYALRGKAMTGGYVSEVIARGPGHGGVQRLHVPHRRRAHGRLLRRAPGGDAPPLPP